MQVKSRQNRIHAEQNTGQRVVETDTATIPVNQFVTHVNNAAGDDVIKLPPVAESAGGMYFILTVDATGSGVDVIDQGDALYSATEAATPVDVSSAVAIDAAGDFLLMYSTGTCWVCLAYNIA